MLCDPIWCATLSGVRPYLVCDLVAGECCCSRSRPGSWCSSQSLWFGGRRCGNCVHGKTSVESKECVYVCGAQVTSLAAQPPPAEGIRGGQPAHTPPVGLQALQKMKRKSWKGRRER
eukprot:363174-Chlamydomonas_euryale.AAC.3